MMIWMMWIELYCDAVDELWFGKPEPVARPSAVVIDMADERAKRRRAAMRAS
jgi:hypothetical protein